MRFWPYLLLLLLVLLAALADVLPETGWLGTTRMGDDLLQDVAKGARTSLIVGVGATALATVLGMLLGILAGMDDNRRTVLPVWTGAVILAAGPVGWFYGFRVWTDLPEGSGPMPVVRGLMVLAVLGLFAGTGWSLSRGVPVLDRRVRFPVATLITGGAATLDALPSLLLVVALAAVLPKGLTTTVLIIGLTGWMGIARLVQVSVRQTLEMAFVEAARVSGIPGWRIALRHVLPSVGGTLLTLIPVSVGSAIMAEGTLAYLGLGAAGDHVSWGAMLAACQHVAHGWRLALPPGMAIFLTVLACNQLARNWGTRR